MNFTVYNYHLCLTQDVSANYKESNAYKTKFEDSFHVFAKIWQP